MQGGGMGIDGVLRPELVPAQQQLIRADRFFRVKRRRGVRHIVFLPGLVLKLGKSRAERRMLTAESAAASSAAGHPFWGELPLRSYRLAGAGVVIRRFRPVELADFDAVSEIIEDRLNACRDYPRRSMLTDVSARRLTGLLDDCERARIETLLASEAVPASSMHGDMHLWNFVQTGAAYRLIDWEHYDPSGSFAFDYVDFHVAVDHANTRTPWAETLAGVGPGHRAVQRAAGLLGVAPHALATYYRLTKLDTVLARMGHVPQQERAGHVITFRRLLAMIGAALGCSAEPASQYALLCCAV